MRDTFIVHYRQSREQTSLSPTLPSSLPKSLMKLLCIEEMDDENLCALMMQCYLVHGKRLGANTWGKYN